MGGAGAIYHSHETYDRPVQHLSTLIMRAANATEEEKSEGGGAITMGLGMGGTNSIKMAFRIKATVP